MDFYCIVVRYGFCILGFIKLIYLEMIMGIILNGWYLYNIWQIVKKVV